MKSAQKRKLLSPSRCFDEVRSRQTWEFRRSGIDALTDGVIFCKMRKFPGDDVVQIHTEITADELSQAVGLNQPSSHWLKVLQANGLAVALLVGILWAEIKSLMAGKHVPPVSWALLLIPALLIWFYWFRKHSAVRRAVSKPSNTPGTASVDANGISYTTSTGAPSFVPWSEYSGWKEGKDVFTLTKAKSFHVLPKRGLNEAEAEQLRSLFRSQIR